MGFRPGLRDSFSTCLVALIDQFPSLLLATTPWSFNRTSRFGCTSRLSSNGATPSIYLAAFRKLPTPRLSKRLRRFRSNGGHQRISSRQQHHFHPCSARKFPPRADEAAVRST